MKWAEELLDELEEKTKMFLYLPDVLYGRAWTGRLGGGDRLLRRRSRRVTMGIGRVDQNEFQFIQSLDSEAKYRLL